MHICFVEIGYPHPHGGGGAGTYVRIVGQELVKRGHHVSVVAAPCSICPEAADDGGIRVLRPRYRINFHWFVSKIPFIGPASNAVRYLERGWTIYHFLNQLHRQAPIDVCEFTEGGDFWHAVRRTFPFVCHLHGSRYTFLNVTGRPAGWGERITRRLELFFIRRAGQVVSPSKALLDIVNKEAGRRLPESAVLPYPIPSDLLADNMARGLPDEKIILFAARNDPVKGADVLLRAVPYVLAVVPDAKFWLFGYKPSSVEQSVESVVFHPFASRDQLLEKYRQARICVVPSRWDNSPNTVYEAMACGKAVVASCVGGIPEIVRDAETGILVDPGNEKHLAEALIKLLKNDALCARYGRAGQTHIAELADLEKDVDRRIAIYERLMKKG